MAVNQYCLEGGMKTAQVVALLFDGRYSGAAIARVVATPEHRVTRQAIWAFKRRHKQDIQAMFDRLYEQLGLAPRDWQQEPLGQKWSRRSYC